MEQCNPLQNGHRGYLMIMSWHSLQVMLRLSHLILLRFKPLVGALYPRQNPVVLIGFSRQFNYISSPNLDKSVDFVCFRKWRQPTKTTPKWNCLLTVIFWCRIIFKPFGDFFVSPCVRLWKTTLLFTESAPWIDSDSKLQCTWHGCHYVIRSTPVTPKRRGVETYSQRGSSFNSINKIWHQVKQKK